MWSILYAGNFGLTGNRAAERHARSWEGPGDLRNPSSLLSAWWYCHGFEPSCIIGGTWAQNTVMSRPTRWCHWQLLNLVFFLWRFSWSSVMVVGWTGDCHKALVECILEQSSRRKGAIHVLFLFFHDLAKGEYVDEYCCMQVLDNPKLLKRSLRREEQQRQKSSKKWWVLRMTGAFCLCFDTVMDSLMKRLANLLFMNRKERKAIESKTHQTKQQTRRENITQRQDAKKERQIAKVKTLSSSHSAFKPWLWVLRVL